MVTTNNISTLLALNVETLQRLRTALETISPSLYKHVNTKGRASVGQHVRHTLEFFECLLEGGRFVNYDERKRDILVESSSDYAMVTIDKVIKNLEGVTKDFPLVLKAGLPTSSSQQLQVSSSCSRELLYVLEHSNHHMALIRILIKDEEPEFVLEESFGVAYSTLAYRGLQANG
jgi:uncharacterized damage-inducible protein DinB